MGLRDELLAAMKVRHEDTEVHGVTVRVTALTAEMQLEIASDPDKHQGDLTFWVLENCVLDPATDERLFIDNDPALRKLSGDIIADLANKAMMLSNVSEAAKN